MKRILLAALLLIGGMAGALAASGSQLWSPQTLTANSTIAVTNTFQVALAAPSGNRNGCTVQNQGPHTMYVYFGVSASATTALSYQVSPGQTIYCSVNNIVLQDIVNITGTAGDAYIVTSQ